MRRHDSDAHPADEADSGSRIDNVGIAFAVDLEILFGVAGGADGGVMENEISFGAGIRVFQRSDADGPAFGCRRRPWGAR